MRHLLFCLFLLIPVSAHAANKIGYVNLRKALDAVEDGRYAKAQLKKKKVAFQKKLNKLQIALKKERDRFKTRSAILKGSAKRRAETKLRKKFFQLQQTYTKFTRELARREAVEIRKIFRKMETIIQKIAKENGLILMLEKSESSVLYALPGMNFTNDLIRRYNRKYGKRKKKRSRRRRRRRKK